ncbi:MAG TPA: hypothetical protein VI282_13015, partial [Verrucomicrobiae bacterium]
FTKRSRFIAHHLIFELSEISSAPTPAELFWKWKGWLENWEGEPQWLEDNRPLPPRGDRPGLLTKSDLWVTGDESDRQNFLPTLMDRGADWEITFTNCFQPGDHADDFEIKAAWPNTPGYEAAKRLDASFIRLDQLPQSSKKLHIAASAETQSAAEPTPAPVPRPAAERKPSFNPILPLAAVAVTVTAFLITLYLRHRVPEHPAQTLTPIAISPKPPAVTAGLNDFLPNRPTWLIVADRPSAIPPANDLMRELRANEVFTKNLSASLQPNLLDPPVAATLFAQPDHNLLRFDATNVAPVELTIANPVSCKTDLRDSFAVEIPGRFRILAIKTPVQIPRSDLIVATNVELQSDLAERIHRLEIPSRSQLALRPLVQSKGSWIDPLADLEHDFALIPSTILDLPAVHAHVAKIIADKESKLHAYEEEAAAISADQKKILTDPTTEQLKAKDRLTALNLAIPKAKHELKNLRAKAAAIPADAATIDRFALFLCLSNVNTEIIRFIEKP